MENPADKGGGCPSHGRAEEVAVLPKKEPEEEIQFQRPNIVNCPTDISTYYNGKGFGKLISMLRLVGGEELVDTFRGTCFGHFIDLDFGYKCTKALHHLVARLLKINDGDEDLWFYIRGSIVRFSAPEFALITGLNFGGSSFDPKVQYDLRVAKAFQAFCGGEQMKVGHLLQRVLDRSRMVKDDDGSLYLRAVLVCVTHTIIFGSDRAVEGWVWSLVENLEAFNKFPWGAYSYRLFLHHLKNGGGKRGKKWHLYGPQWALSIWGFERIEGFGEEVARYVGGGSLRPRCVRWKFRMKSVTEDLDWQMFFDDKERKIWDMHPEEDEMEEAYYVTAIGPTPLSVCFAAPHKLTRGQPRAHGSSAARHTVEEGSGVAATTRHRGRQCRVDVEEDKGLQDEDVGQEDADVGLHDVDVGLDEQPRGSTSWGDAGKRTRAPTPSSSSSSHGATPPGLRLDYLATPGLRLTSRDRKWIQETIKESEGRLHMDIQRNIQEMKKWFTKQFKKWKCESSHLVRSYNPSQQRMPSLQLQRIDVDREDATSHDREGMHHDCPVQSMPSSRPPQVDPTSLQNLPCRSMHEVGSSYGGPRAEIQEQPRHSMSEARYMEHPVDTNQLDPQEDFVSQLETPPGFNVGSVIAVETTGEEKKEQSFDGGSSSMPILRKTESGASPKVLKKPAPEDAFGHEEQCEVLRNDPRLDNGVTGCWKPFAYQEDSVMPNEENRLKRDSPVRAQSNSAEPSKRKAGTSPPRAANVPDWLADLLSSKLTAKKKRKKSSSTSKRTRRYPSLGEETSDDEGSESSSGEWLADLLSSKLTGKKKRKKKSSMSLRTRRYPSSDEETSDDEGSESSSGEGRRRQMKKRDKKKKRKQSESSLSESSDSDRHRRRRNKHKHRRASSSESSDSDARGSRRRQRQRHSRRQRHRHHSVSSSD